MLRDRQAVWRNCHRHRRRPAHCLCQKIGARAAYLSHQVGATSNFLALWALLIPVRPRRYPGQSGAVMTVERGRLQLSLPMTPCNFFVNPGLQWRAVDILLV